MKSGIAAARSKGTTLGPPRIAVDAVRINALRAQGMYWAKVGEQLGLGEGTVQRTGLASAKNHLRQVSEPLIGHVGVHEHDIGLQGSS